MRFKTAAGIFSVVFNYDFQNEVKGFRGDIAWKIVMEGVPCVGPTRKVRVTTCKLFKLPNSKAKVEDGKEIASVKAKQSILDGDNKAIARKIALTRVLRKAGDNLGKNHQEQRKIRSEIWKQYFSKVSL